MHMHTNIPAHIPIHMHRHAWLAEGRSWTPSDHRESADAALMFQVPSFTQQP